MLEEQQENTMTEADQQRAREALAGLLVEYSDTDGPVTSYTTGPADGDEDAVLNLAERFAEVRADERAELQDRIEELEKNLSYEVEQKIKLADMLRDERAKRPDREQIETIIADGVNTLTAEQLRELFIDPVAIANDVFAAFEGGRDV